MGIVVQKYGGSSLADADVRSKEQIQLRPDAAANAVCRELRIRVRPPWSCGTKKIWMPTSSVGACTHLLPDGHCAHRPQPPTTDYAPQPPPLTLHAYLDEATAEVRGDAVENDEVIPHALQEELAQVAMAKASGTSPPAT